MARRTLDEEIDVIYKSLRELGHKNEEEKKRLEKQLAEKTSHGEALDETIRAAMLEYHFKFHPVWGKLFEAGFQESRFAKQVSTYACIYTSKASNLGLMSPERWFRATRDASPHELHCAGKPI